MNEAHVTMNYADAVQGTNELTFWMMLFDGTTIDTGVIKACLLYTSDAADE